MRAMIPVSSATSRKAAGVRSPSVGCSQRTSASSAARRWVSRRDHRLVVHGELTGVDRAPQLALDAAAGRRLGPQVVVEDLDTSAAALLGVVHRRVGVAEELLGWPAVDARDPHARADDELGVVDDKGRATTRNSRSATAVTSEVSARPSHTTTNSSPPKRATASPSRNAPRKRCASSTQDAVAGVVPDAVVEDLEPVDVEEEHRGVSVGGAALGDLAEALDQPVSVRAGS